LFKDRHEAGRLLAARLAFLKGDKDVIILGIPRGGVIVAKEIADAIGAPLDLIIPRKLRAPGNPELAIGAVTQDGETIIDPKFMRILKVTETYLVDEAATQTAEIRRRMTSYRGKRPTPNFEGKTVVIVDDGVATGSTVRAAIQSVRRMKAAMVLVAVPVGPPETIADLSRFADRVICLNTPEPFYAIGGFYDEFGQVEDDAVRHALRIE